MNLVSKIYSAVQRTMAIRPGLIFLAFLYLIPGHALSDESKKLPLKSLYMIHQGGGQLSIEEMINRSGMSAEKFVQEKIIAPFAGHWVDLAVKKGIITEAIAFEISETGLPTGQFVFQEFEGHDKAMIESLESSFERGFLLGLGDKLSALGYSNLSYEGLTKLLREDLAAEVQRRGFRPGVGTDYSLLTTAIQVLRIKGPLRPQKCESVLWY